MEPAGEPANLVPGHVHTQTIGSGEEQSSHDDDTAWAGLEQGTSNCGRDEGLTARPTACWIC